MAWVREVNADQHGNRFSIRLLFYGNNFQGGRGGGGGGDVLDARSGIASSRFSTERVQCPGRDASFNGTERKISSISLPSSSSPPPHSHITGPERTDGRPETRSTLRRGRRVREGTVYTRIEQRGRCRARLTRVDQNGRRARRVQVGRSVAFGRGFDQLVFGGGRRGRGAARAAGRAVRLGRRGLRDGRRPLVGGDPLGKRLVDRRLVRLVRVPRQTEQERGRGRRVEHDARPKLVGRQERQRAGQRRRRW